ncbi:nitronate monooxygenase [Kribbella sandramycini]|uniref:Nitronate monooxygenase n=1 Tax=Kribbella sandramycini TaxID=60450 RepID=A0A7Y4L7A9_9ACTN|nr:nitronate monooxygenase [Kribbella sandramycini]MBB6567197.1 nitronate monooxygenase [Kribbella sandramycini]NOL45735.1 nitronate monooxygenase [Kribbella sandramycini]
MWLSERFGVSVPVVGAPMANVSGGKLTAAISAAGGLGMLGAGSAVSAEWIRTEGAIAAAGGKPWGIGLMAWSVAERPEHLAAVLELRPQLVSLSFGDYSAYVGPLRDAGIVVATQAGTVADAREAIAAGVDVIVVRGAEAGGHGRNAVGTLPLLQAVLDLTDLPVLAGGGISGPRGLAAVLAAGAAGGWIGTAFLTCVEALTADAVRQRVIAADETDTVYGTVFDAASRAGWPDEFGGRALRNEYFDRWEGREQELKTDDAGHADYVEGSRAADTSRASIYAGQGVGALTGQPTAAEVLDGFAGYRSYLQAALNGGAK